MKGMSMSMRRREVGCLGAVTSWLSNRLSERQLVLCLSLVVGLLTGLVAYVLKWTVEAIGELLRSGFADDRMNWLYLVYPAVGILLSGIFIRYIVRDDIGHGVTKVLYAISRKRARIKPHNRWSSLVASAVTIGTGGSVGAEAPIVLTGSAIGSDLGKRFHLQPSTVMLLVGCGAAGAVSGIFKAPIAGMMFVLEVLMLDLSMALLLPLMVSSLSSACVSYALSGTSAMFDFSLQTAFSINIIPACVLLGAVCGLVSLYFTRSMNWFERIFARLTQPWAKFLVGAVTLGLLIYFLPALYGEGYAVIEQLIDGVGADDVMAGSMFYGGGMRALVLYLSLVLMLKVFASAATNGGGGCGGVFAPSLFVGALTGFVFAALWNYFLNIDDGRDGYMQAANCVLFGMAGLMSGVMHAPLTGIFLIAELTGGYQLFVPIMIVSAMSYLTIRVFEPHSIYAMRLARKGELLTHDKDSAILTVLSLESLIERDFQTVRPEWSLTKIVVAVEHSHRNLFPVVDGAGHLVGVMSLDSVRKYIFRPELYHQYRVSSFMKPAPAVLTTADTLKVAAAKFDETRAWNLPVCNDDGHFIGFISRSGLFNSYRKTLVNFTAE